MTLPVVEKGRDSDSGVCGCDAPRRLEEAHLAVERLVEGVEEGDGREQHLPARRAGAGRRFVYIRFVSFGSFYSVCFSHFFHFLSFQ